MRETHRKDTRTCHQRTKKQDTVREVCEQINCTPDQAIVIGDGANDLRMMAIAGISVAYRAKPIVRSETKHAVNHCGLDSILNYFSDAQSR